MYHLTRSDDEVNDLLNRASDEFEQTTSPAAEAVTRTVNWLTGATDEHPLD